MPTNHPLRTAIIVRAAFFTALRNACRGGALPNRQFCWLPTAYTRGRLTTDLQIAVAGTPASQYQI